jgi:replicative DNA helicase
MDANFYNLNIERAVLSSVLYDSAVFDDISGVMNEDEFYHPFHKAVYATMMHLSATSMPIDEEFIRQKYKGAEFDSDSFFEVLSTTPLPNLKPYIAELKELSTKRKLFSFTNEIKAECMEQKESSEIIDSAETKLFKIATASSTRDFREPEEVTKSTLDYMLEMKKRGDNLLVGLDTGFYELNKKNAGFGKGDLVIIAARPAMGKTAFALNIASHALSQGVGVAIFSLEMPAEQLMLRMLAAKTSIPLQDLRVANIDDGQWSRLTDAIQHFSDSKLFVDDEGGLTMSVLRSKLRKLKARHKEVGVAIIDYLQIMSSSGNKDRHLEVSDMSRGLKLLARELEMPIIALSQLNRGLEARADKRPMLSDLRESGSIEQDADQILFVYRDDVYRAREEKEKEMKAKAEGKEYKNNFSEKTEEEAEIIIGKNRNGPTGIVNLVFHKRFTRFEAAGGHFTEHVFAETKAPIENIEFSHIKL